MEMVSRKERTETISEAQVIFSANACNEQFARITAAAFITPFNPTLEEMSDIKTAVSEAVTNAVIHGYENKERMEDKIEMRLLLTGDVFTVQIRDWGVGIENVDKAMEPLYTTKPELERSGMGFAFMEAFMDHLEVESAKNAGTVVMMKKKLGVSHWLEVS